MKTNQFVLLVLIMGSCLLSFGGSAPQKSKIWKPLFGNDLSMAKYDRNCWKIVNGALTASQDKMIWAVGNYENFVVDVEFKNEDGTNSGVIVYCTDTANWIPHSVEIQIADDYCEKWGTARKDYQCGAIFGHLPANQQKVVKKPGEWNRMQITCKGKSIDVVLNGRKVTKIDMNLWKSGKVNPDGSTIPEWLPNPLAGLPTKGWIGLQGKHADATIWFRNVMIMEL